MNKIIKLSDTTMIDGVELTKPLFNIYEVDTMVDVNGNEVQIPRLVETTSASAIQYKIDVKLAEIAVLQGHLNASKQVEVIKEVAEEIK